MKRLIRLIPVAAAALAAAVLFFRPMPSPGGAATAIGPRLAAPDAAASGDAAGGAAAPGWFVPRPAAQPPKPRRTAAPATVVYVAGAVRRPGVYAVPASARVNDALARAGGGRADADLVAVNLAAHLHDGDEIAVPVVGAVPPARASRPRGSGVRAARDDGPARAGRTGRGPRGGPSAGRPARSDGGRRSSRADAAPPDSVDLNSADAPTLETLPGVGPALAARIVLYRESNGPFGSIDELLDVSGITERRLELISPYVDVR